MKKSLLIILSLIFMSMTAHAVGVDCWEEYSQYFFPSTESKMKDILGNNVEIVRVKSAYRMIAYKWDTDTDSADTFFIETVDIPLFEPFSVNWSYSGNTFYLYAPKMFLDSNTTSGKSGYIYYSAIAGEKYNHFITEDMATKEESRSYGFLFNGYYYSSDYARQNEIQPNATTFVHTYCIENTNSGGGGGGAAGASVNYIIKAN